MPCSSVCWPAPIRLLVLHIRKTFMHLCMLTRENAGAHERPYSNINMSIKLTYNRSSLHGNWTSACWYCIYLARSVQYCTSVYKALEVAPLIVPAHARSSTAVDAEVVLRNGVGREIPDWCEEQLIPRQVTTLSTRQWEKVGAE